MMMQGPVIQAAIARLPEMKTMLAATGIVISLSVTIESPVIMLLATSTALVTSARAYRVLRRFALNLTILLTIVAASIAFVDPIYNWLVPGLMGIPAHIAEVTQPGMQIMTFWSMAIGWRRFYQGILIRFEQTRWVGYGTVVRLVAVAVTAFSLVIFSDWSGVIVGGCTWMTGVLAELMFIYFIARSTVKTHLSGLDDPNQAQLSYRDVVRYHTPLAATSLLTLLAQPMIGAGLARMVFPEENLAAWPIIFTIWLFFRSFGLALPEVVLAMFNGSETLSPLRRFCMRVATGSSLALAVMIFSPMITFYLLYITGVTTELVQFIIPGAVVGLFIPALQAIQSWLRGVLMVAKVTGDIYWGMGFNLVATGLLLVAGVMWQAPGAPVAAVALTMGMIVENIYLWQRVKPVQVKLQLAPKISC
jgi:hypothetical protein